MPPAIIAATTAAPAPGYDRMEKVDEEEARHIKAQYLIHKVLEEASSASASTATRSRRPPPALVRVKARVGVRLKKLRLAIRGVRVRARRAVQRHLRNLTRLIAHGGGRRGRGRAGRGSSSVKPAVPPPS